MTDLSKRNCGLCEYFKFKDNPYLDRFFDHYCTEGGKEKYLGDDGFPAKQNVCKDFLKKIKIEDWSSYPWQVIKSTSKTVVMWNDKTEEAKVLSREDALVFIRQLDRNK